MGQDQSSVFDLAAVAAASNGGNNDPLLPPARFIGAPQKPSDMPYTKYVAYDKQAKKFKQALKQYGTKQDEEQASEEE